MAHGLIFDIGVHKGFDARFYLRKGFTVVGLEAAPALCAQAYKTLEPFIKARRCVLVNRALAERSGETVSFYLNPDKDDWGSLRRELAEKGQGQAETITVTTITLSDLLDRFGTPYYLKCDIEGGDQVLLEQLKADTRRPPFISVEANAVEDLDALEACGYEVVQLVNQWLHAFTRPPEPAREGVYVDARFNGETSGLFGRELPPDRWINFDEARLRYSAWKSLRDRDDTLALGWIDFHATKRSTLAG